MTVLQAYEDHPQLISTQFFDLLVNIHQTLNDSMGVDGGEKFDELLKYIDNFQPQVFIKTTKSLFNRFILVKFIRSYTYYYTSTMD